MGRVWTTVAVIARRLAGHLAAGPEPRDYRAAPTLDPKAQDLIALRGAVIWPRRRGRLMRRIGARTSRVPGVPASRAACALDLGREDHGRVLATYIQP